MSVDALSEEVKPHLDQIKKLKGVENAVLTQRDGNPIQSTGVWFSKDEIFSVCSAACAIYNVGIHLHPNDLKYILIEGTKAKILIAPLISPLHGSLNEALEKMGIMDDRHEFFIAITAQPNINLGGIFLQTNECLRRIKISLVSSGKSFKPPLIQFDNEKVQSIISGFNVKEAEEFNYKVSTFSLNITKKIKLNMKKLLTDFSLTVPDLNYAFVTIEGGFIAAKLLKKSLIDYDKLDNISAMNYSLFQTANRCAWLLKKMRAENVLLDCNNHFLFIKGLGKTIFCAEIGKSSQKLGLLRLILPQYSKKVNNLIREVFEIPKKADFDVKNILKNIKF